MSSPSPTHDHPGGSAPSHGTLLRPVEAAGFWAAVALPFIYVPLVVQGPETPTAWLTLALLIATHLLALLLGHTYHTD